MVYVTYFDEIKPNPRYNQPYYWLGAISIPMADIHGIEAKVNALAKKYFGSEELTTATEFHSIDIYFRTGNFKAEADVGKRLQVFKELFEIFDGADRMKRVLIKIIPENLVHTQQTPESIAFMYLCEQVDAVMKQLESHTLLIGDQDDERSNAAVQEFLEYRTHGTSWRRGQDLQWVIDSLYFTRSHHSRLLPLVDVYTFSVRVKWGTMLNGAIFGDLRRTIEASSVSNHSACRMWPTEPLWYRV
jgi:hypothetical protein